MRSVKNGKKLPQLSKHIGTNINGGLNENLSIVNDSIIFKLKGNKMKFLAGVIVGIFLSVVGVQGVSNIISNSVASVQSYAKDVTKDIQK